MAIQAFYRVEQAELQASFAQIMKNLICVFKYVQNVTQKHESLGLAVA